MAAAGAEVAAELLYIPDKANLLLLLVGSTLPMYSVCWWWVGNWVFVRSQPGVLYIMVMGPGHCTVLAAEFIIPMPESRDSQDSFLVASILELILERAVCLGLGLMDLDVILTQLDLWMTSLVLMSGILLCNS